MIVARGAESGAFKESPAQLVRVVGITVGAPHVSRSRMYTSDTDACVHTHMTCKRHACEFANERNHVLDACMPCCKCMHVHDGCSWPDMRTGKSMRCRRCICIMHVALHDSLPFGSLWAVTLGRQWATLGSDIGRHWAVAQEQHWATLDRHLEGGVV
eukprot:365733-Chlamydomonas_euryale.AAC.16